MDPITTIAGVVAVVAPAAWALSRLLTVEGFGGTFLRPNVDLGWPHGVQEDDDVHWHWDRPDEPRLGPAIGRAPGRPPVRPAVASPLLIQGPTAKRTGSPGEGEILERGVSAIDVRPVRRVH